MKCAPFHAFQSGITNRSMVRADRSKRKCHPWEGSKLRVLQDKYDVIFQNEKNKLGKIETQCLKQKDSNQI